MYFDSTFLILIPFMLLSAWAQAKVRGAFSRYSGVMCTKRVSSTVVARRLLDMNGLTGVRIETIAGELTDHYDPRDKVLRLSDSVNASSSIASIGVAAHEVGHAVQDGTGYGLLKFRNSMVPVVNIGSNASWLLFFLGLVMSIGPLVTLGIALFSLGVIFHLVTLPVELDASSRALKMLSSTGTLNDQELDGARQVLSAAAWTYVAATLMSIAQLLRLIMIANRNRRR